MKIRESYDRAASLVGVHEKEDKKVRDSKSTSFQTHYRRTQQGSYDEQLNELLGDINKQADILKKRMDIVELKVYKQLISEFLSMVVGGSHKFSKESMLDRRGRYKVWGIVRQVNEELDKLTQEVLKEEKSQLTILSHMEGIQGLIMDIMM